MEDIQLVEDSEVDVTILTIIRQTDCKDKDRDMNFEKSNQ